MVQILFENNMTALWMECLFLCCCNMCMCLRVGVQIVLQLSVWKLKKGFWKENLETLCDGFNLLSLLENIWGSCALMNSFSKKLQKHLNHLCKLFDKLIKKMNYFSSHRSVKMKKKIALHSLILCT